MKIITPQILGILAVITFLLSYQQKKRSQIIAFNTISRVLYILQYILLGAYEGAVLDILGAASSVLAQRKDAPFIKTHIKIIFISVNVSIAVMGLILYKNIFSLLPIIGVLLHTSAFWLDNEKVIRRVSLLGSPFWFVYNLVSRAYGSAIGDVLTMASLGIAMYRYDIKHKSNEC